MNTIANLQKAAQNALKIGTAEGCMTREMLAKEIKAAVGGRPDMTALTNWIGNSVKLGLFNTDAVAYRLKRGITGGIEAVRPKAKRSRKVAASVVQATATSSSPQPRPAQA